MLVCCWLQKLGGVDPTLPRIAAAVLLAGAVLLAVLLAGESSRAMLASARLSCNLC